MKWLKEYIPANPNEDVGERSKHSPFVSHLIAIISAVKNKFAQVLVLLFHLEYPEGWPTFFSELLELLSVGPVMVDMFLRIIETIDRLVVSSETIRPSSSGIAQHTLIVKIPCTSLFAHSIAER